MSGSKKGERRGGAKLGRRRSPFVNGHKIKGGRPAGAKSAPRIDHEVTKILNSHASPAERERKMETYFIVTGRRIRMPREVMLDAMRYFEETAIEYHDVLQANLDASAAADTPEAREVYETAVAVAENRMRENLSLAVDVAYKVAPFCHPRLAAIVTNPGADAKNPFNVLSLLMQDIDEAGKPARFIDHNPDERPGRPESR